MIPMKHFLTSVWGERTVTQWVAGSMSLVHLGLGLAILVGGIRRFSAPTYLPIIDIVDGQVWIWGAWIILSAVLMVTPLRWPNIIGLSIGILWMHTWCGLFVVSVSSYETSSAVEMVAYGGFAMIDTALLAVRVLDRDAR